MKKKILQRTFLKFMEKSTFIFISGTAGAGKNTIISELVKQDDNVVFLRSHTSRPQRVDDHDETYYYIDSNEEFERLINRGEILEFDKFNNYYYGISKKEIAKNEKLGKVIIKDVSTLGVSNLRAMKMEFTSVFLTTSKKELKARLIDRGTDEKIIKKRLNLYSFEQDRMPTYDYIIENTDQALTIDKMMAITNVESNNLNIRTLEPCQNVLERKLEKLVTRLEKGRDIGYVKVIAKNDEIYIVEGVNEYLAYLKTNKHCPKMFVDSTHLNEDEKNSEEWEKLLELYKN